MVLRQILQWKERESVITNGVGGTSNIWNTEESDFLVLTILDLLSVEGKSSGNLGDYIFTF